MRIISIGLYSLSESFEKKATQLYKLSEYEESKVYFEMSIAICETSDNITGYADLLDDMNLFKKSVQYYQKAIEDYNCSIAMFNLGITLMEKFKNQINDENQGSNNKEKNNYFMESIKLFDSSIENETSKYKKHDNILDCIYQGIDYSTWYISEIDNINISNRDKTALGLYDILLKINNKIKNCMSSETIINLSLIFNKWIAMLKEFNDIRVYENKIKLFEGLNNIVTCNICYDNKLNIDLNCGHTVCKDCYIKLYLDKCPFCRIKCVTSYCDLFDYYLHD